jgi:hypothetical protein
MQVIGNDDAIETSRGIRPGRSFQISATSRNPGNTGKACEGCAVAVHRLHLIAQARQIAGMPAAAAGKVQHRPARRDQMGESAHPGRGRKLLMRMNLQHPFLAPGQNQVRLASQVAKAEDI